MTKPKREPFTRATSEADLTGYPLWRMRQARRARRFAIARFALRPMVLRRIELRRIELRRTSSWHSERRLRIPHVITATCALAAMVVFAFTMSGLRPVRGDERPTAATPSTPSDNPGVEATGESELEDAAKPKPPEARSSTVAFVLTEAENEVPDRFRLKPHRFPFSLTPRERTGWLRRRGEYLLTFPSPVATEFECNNTVHCEYFSPVGDGQHPGVIILHILGGDFDLSRGIARGLARSGIGALFLKMPYYGPRRPEGRRIRMISEDLDRTVSAMTQAVLDIRRARAWLADRPEVDEQQLGITGISLGGIVATLAASADPEFERACLILAGGNLEKIIRESEETRDIRDVWERKKFDLEQVRAELAKVDPLTYADRLKNRKVLMFNASNDRVIPPDCTKALWQSMGKPEIHWWPANHYSAAFYLPTGMNQMIKFYRQP